jgi:hypothetical protein
MNKDAGVYDRMDNDDEHNLCAIKRFSGILARQLVMMGIGLRPVQRPVNLVFPGGDVIESLQETMKSNNDDKDDNKDKDKDDDDNGKVGATSSVSSIGVGSSGGSAGSNDSTSTFGGSKSNKNGYILRMMTDRMGCKHTASKFSWKQQGMNGKGYTPAKK